MFQKFQSTQTEEILDFLTSLLDDHNNLHDHLVIKATGGGAFLHFDLLQERLKCRVVREDEMNCLIKGLDFLLREISNEVFTYTDKHVMEYVDDDTCSKRIYPYMV